MVSPLDVLRPMLRKLESRAPLDDRIAPPCWRSTSAAKPGAGRLYRPGGRAPAQLLRHSHRLPLADKVTVEGARQIVSVHIPGDFVDLEGSLLNVADHNVQALTRCEVLFIPRDAVRDLIIGHPRIGMAMWVDTLIDGSIFREWMVNLGRRDARARIAHLLCEIARRLEVAGLAEDYRYELPMTQEQLADATGLTSVHVNRVLQALAREGLIERNKRFVGIPDWERLRQTAGFTEIYLHLDQVQRGPIEAAAA